MKKYLLAALLLIAPAAAAEPECFKVEALTFGTVGKVAYTGAGDNPFSGTTVIDNRGPANITRKYRLFADDVRAYKGGDKLSARSCQTGEIVVLNVDQIVRVR